MVDAVMKKGDKVDVGGMEFEVVSVYTRGQAIDDGFLVDVSELAKEAGFRFPVAVTRGLWDRYLEPPTNVEGEGQSETGRLWDILNVLRVEIRNQRSACEILLFKVRFRMAARYEKPTLKSVCGPGDHAEPVITIMLDDED